MANPDHVYSPEYMDRLRCLMGGEAERLARLNLEEAFADKAWVARFQAAAKAAYADELKRSEYAL